MSAAASALGAGLLKLGYDAVTGADDLNTLSKQTGVSTETLQKMQYAADRVDVSVDDITGALVKMKKNMAGNTSAFDKLGISVTNADGSMRSIEDIFNDTIVTLSYVQDEVERDQIAMDIFGKSADSLAGIIDDGGAALKQFGDEAEQAGLILSQDTLDALNETNDTIDKLKANISGTMGKIGADVAQTLAPALEQLATKIEDVTTNIRSLTPEQQTMLLLITGIVAVLAPLTIAIGAVITAVGTIVGALGTLTGVLAPLIAGIGAFASSFAAPLAAIAAAIAIGVLLYKNWDTICAKAAETKDKVVAKFEEIKTGIATKIDAAKQAASEKIDAIKTKITTTADSIKSAVTTKFEAIKTAITKPIESAKTAVANAIEAIKSKINNANFSLPKIKLPHFSISGNFSLNPPSIPKFSVSWYKKAHQNAVLFTSPTVLPTLNGYKGFGDGGAEVVMDYGKLASMVGDTYITVNAAPGMDVRQLADEVQLRLAQVQKQRASVYV